MVHEQKIGDLKAEHSYYCQYFSSLRNRLVQSRKLDEKQLSYLISSSNETIKVNCNLSTQWSNYGQKYEQCCIHGRDCHKTAAGNYCTSHRKGSQLVTFIHRYCHNKAQLCMLVLVENSILQVSEQVETALMHYTCEAPRDSNIIT